jgi:kumamolisin
VDHRHIARAAAALASLAIWQLVGQSAWAGGAVKFDAAAHVAGPVDGAARTYFTVRLQPGSTAQDAEVVAGYLRGFGISVTSDVDDGILFASGSYAQTGLAANSRFATVSSHGSRFVALLGRPSFPPAVASRIRETTLGGGPPALGPTGPDPDGIVTGPASGFHPADIFKYYDYGSIETSGSQANNEHIAIVTCGAVSDSDVETYETDDGLPTNVPTAVQVDGGSTTTGFYTTALIEVLAATAQLASITDYVLPNACNVTNIADATAKVLADEKTANYVALVLIYGDFEDVYEYYGLDSTLMAEDGDFKSLAAKGVTSFVANGDDTGFSNLEAGDPGVFFPASDPNVVTIGTTMALVNGSGNRLFEPASYSSNGGVSELFAIPKWQKSVPGIASKTMRNSPDVSFNGDCQLEYYAIYQGGTYYACGSGFGADSWAGLLALVDAGRTTALKKPLGAVASKLYGQRSVSGFYTDVTVGCNGVYCAGTGYDEVTGLGVPDATIVYNTLVGLP